MFHTRHLALVLVLAAGACATDTPAPAEPQLFDHEATDTVELDRSGNWSVQLDKTSNQLSASDGLTTVSLDPNAPRQTQRDLLDAGLGEHAAAGWQAWVCRATCVGLAATSCFAMGVACTGVSVVSIGGFLIPCAVATAVACVGGSVAAQVCSDFCGQAFP